MVTVKLLKLNDQRFTKLIALYPIEERPRKWVCQCDCGEIKEVLQTHLVQGNIKSCGCIRRGVLNALWGGYGEISGDRFNSIKSKLRHPELGFTITLKQIWDLFLKQERKCALSGLDIYFGKTNEDKFTASLDRKDSKKGYHIDNVQWVHKTVNIMKNVYSEDKFIEMCNFIVNPLVKENNDFIKKTSISKNKWRDIKRAAKRGIYLDIDELYILELFNTQKGKCALTGLPIILNIYGSDEYMNIASLDRINSDIGYVRGNVQWVHKMINKMKGKLDQFEFKKICESITNYVIIPKRSLE